MLPMGTSLGMEIKLSQEETSVLSWWASQGAFHLGVCPRSAAERPGLRRAKSLTLHQHE